MLEPYHYLESGLSNVYLTSGVITSNDPEHGPSRAIPQLKELYHEMGLCLINAPRRLEPEEVKFMRVGMGMSLADLGVCYSTTPDVMGKVETGEAKMFVFEEYFLRTLLADYLEVEYKPKYIIALITSKQERVDLRFGWKLSYGLWSWELEK